MASRQTSTFASPTQCHTVLLPTYGMVWCSGGRSPTRVADKRWPDIAGHLVAKAPPSATTVIFAYPSFRQFKICSGIIIFQIHSITFHIFSLCQTNMSNQNTFNCIYHFRIRALQDRQQQITRDKTQPGYLLSHCSRDSTSKTHL